MSEQTAPEPSMDEILASIRRIISEDDAPAGATAAAGGGRSDADVLELTDKVPSGPAKGGHAPMKESPPATIPPSAPPAAREALVGDAAAGAAESSFEALKVSAEDAAKARATMDLPPPGRSLEDVTRELLRPLLKAWLDENLPTIVRTSVEEEVARIARGRVR